MLRASKEELSANLNDQTQAPDIPGFSIDTIITEYTVSLQSQVKTPDIPSRSLRASKHELSTILNAQAQDSDDPCPLHPHGIPREIGSTSSVFNQVLSKVSL